MSDDRMFPAFTPVAAEQRGYWNGRWEWVLRYEWGTPSGYGFRPRHAGNAWTLTGARFAAWRRLRKVARVERDAARLNTGEPT